MKIILKISKQRFLRNLMNYKTNLKNNGLKLMMTAFTPSYALFHAGFTINWEL